MTTHWQLLLAIVLFATVAAVSGDAKPGDKKPGNPVGRKGDKPAPAPQSSAVGKKDEKPKQGPTVVQSKDNKNTQGVKALLNQPPQAVNAKKPETGKPTANVRDSGKGKDASKTKAEVKKTAPAKPNGTNKQRQHGHRVFAGRSARNGHAKRTRSSKKVSQTIGLQKPAAGGSKPAVRREAHSKKTVSAPQPNNKAAVPQKGKKVVRKHPNRGRAKRHYTAPKASPVKTRSTAKKTEKAAVLPPCQAQAAAPAKAIGKRSVAGNRGSKNGKTQPSKGKRVRSRKPWRVQRRKRVQNRGNKRRPVHTNTKGVQNNKQTGSSSSQVKKADTSRAVASKKAEKQPNSNGSRVNRKNPDNKKAAPASAAGKDKKVVRAKRRFFNNRSNRGHKRRAAGRKQDNKPANKSSPVGIKSKDEPKKTGPKK